MSSAMSLFEGPRNLSFNERALSVVGGLGLAAAAAKPRPNPFLNIVALLGGAYLAYRGATGYCPAKAALEGSGGFDRIASGLGMGSADHMSGSGSGARIASRS